jgi:hypothetical protein
MSSYRRLLIFSLLWTPVWGQQQPAAPPTERATVRAVSVMAGETISVDGRLDEPTWKRAEPAADFRQSDPQNGAPATERSEVRIIFDQDHLYIGAELFDSDPNALLANQMVRDGALNADDRFMFTIDPFYDQRSGYFFELNPAGAMGDAQLVPGQGSAEIGTTQNRAWDGIWIARVRRHDQGWTVEIDIPFRTLNFDPSAQAWGANFQRTVRRKNEESFWTGWGRNQGLFNLPFSGRIEGISDVSQGHGVDIKPYLIGRYKDVTRNGLDHSTYTGDTGLDVAYSLTPQLKLQLTLNTDFAQTEVDDRQINLTRFALFFPEKRDFFLEGTGNFDFARERFNILSPFFSRRIGLTESGQPQKIDYGLKMTGQAAGLDLGLIQVRTAAEPGAAGEDFTVFRPKKSFLSQSYAGLYYTRRATRNSTIPDRHSIGADFQLATARFRGNQNLQFGAFYLRTPNPLKAGQDAAWAVRVDYPNDLWTLQFNYREFGKNFDPAVGFTERTDYKKWFNVIQFSPRPRNNRWIRQITIGSRASLFQEFDNRWSDRIFNLTLLGVNFQSGDTLNILVTPSYERLDRDFPVARGITLAKDTEYRYTRYSVTMTTANRRMIAGDANVTLGSFYSGNRRDLGAGLTIRPRPGLLATLTSTFSRIEMPEGNLSTKILRAVVNTQFSPWISVANNVQYDSASRVLGWQSRFRWIVKPGNDIYFVWQSNWLDSGDKLTSTDTSATAKMVYTHRF